MKRRHYRHHRRNPEGGKSMLPWILGGGAVLLLLRGGSGSASGILSSFLPSAPGAAPAPLASGTAQFAIPGVASLASMVGSLVPNINTGAPTAASLNMSPIAPAISPVVTVAPVSGLTTVPHDMTTAQHTAAMALSGMSPAQRAHAVGVPYPVYNVDEATAAHYLQLMYPGLRLPWGPFPAPYPTYAYLVHIAQITRMTPAQATAGILAGQIDMSNGDVQNSIFNSSAIDDIGNNLGNDTNPKKGVQIRANMIIQLGSGIFGYVWVNDATGQHSIVTGWPLIGPGPGWREATQAEVDAIGPSLSGWEWPDEYNTQMAAAQSNPLYQAMYINTNQPNAPGGVG